jgi:hypothetical protein
MRRWSIKNDEKMKLPHIFHTTSEENMEKTRIHLWCWALFIRYLVDVKYLVDFYNSWF